MKPGDLVRINLPERMRVVLEDGDHPHYYHYHGHTGLVISVKKTENQFSDQHKAIVLVGGVARSFSLRYLEAIDETR